MTPRRFLPLLAVLTAGPLLLAADEPTKEGLEFFEKTIRPIFAEHCYECHSIEKGASKGGLILDSRDGMLKGGDQGPAVVPGNVAKSLLLLAVHYGDPEIAMPPKKKGGKIADAKIAALEKWVKMGAPAPAGNGNKLTGLTEKAKQHWAYLPLKAVTPPEVKNKAWVKGPIDAFILAKLEAAGLAPNPAADPEALLRRMSYDLLGLPPTADQVIAFTRAHDAAAAADAAAVRRGTPAGNVDAVVAKQVDFLLASPHYGERWGRHWLDTARYSDTRGLPVDQGKSLYEDYRYAFAWTYRDYVIDALNTDKPYDRFVIEQLAADKLPDIKPDDSRLAALGFITIGKRFDNIDDTIDERIDTTTKAFLGLTVACARCHDHKFDPIPAADYYSLHGIFASTIEPLQRPGITAGPQGATLKVDFQKRLDQLQAESAAGYYKYFKDMRARYDREMAGRLVAATLKRGSIEWGDVNEKYKLETPLPDFEPMRIQADSPITGPFARVAAIPVAVFEERAAGVLAAALNDPKNPVNPLIASALRGLKPKTIDDVALAYQKAYNDSKASILAHIDRCATPGRSSKQTPPAIAQMAAYPWPLPDVEEILENEECIALFDTRKFCADWQNRPVFGGQNNRKPGAYFRWAQVNELRLSHPGAPRVAMNRLWLKHFGEGLVLTPDDLGNMSVPPSHPELLDWLADDFTKNGWTLKRMHRQVMLSSAYRQDSNPNLNPLVARKGAVDPLKIDAANRLLWRGNLRRLDFESIRDSMILLTGKMSPTVGGQPANITDEPYSYRRSLYGYVDRLRLNDTLSQFDYADPDMANSKRGSTIVPQQALFFMNNPLSVEVARSVAARPDVVKAFSEDARINAMFMAIFQRRATSNEIRAARDFLDKQKAMALAAARGTPATGTAKTATSGSSRTSAKGTSGKDAKPANPVAASQGSVTKKGVPATKKVEAPDDMMMSVSTGGAEGILQNVGETIPRNPLTPIELLAHTLLLSNEFVYVN